MRVPTLLPRFCLVAVASILLAWVGTATAVIQVYTCGQACAADCELANDLICGGTYGYGVKLLAGADLDLKGHTITCDGCDPGWSIGVLVDSASSASVIKNPLYRNFGQILGPWYAGVHCQQAAGSRVTGIYIDGAMDTTGISDCRKVDANVVVNCGVGIYNGSIHSSDYIRDNLIKGGVTGIAVVGSGAADIDHNVIVRTSIFGIEAGNATSTSLAITGNVFFQGLGEGGLIRPTNLINGSRNHILSGNVCDDSVSSCVSCINAGKCTKYEAPFVGP